MRSRTLACVTGFLGILAVPIPTEWNPCPDGRTLEHQLETADAVVLGKVTYERDCKPPTADPVDSSLARLDCHGRRADVRILKRWKGPAAVGDGLALTMPAPSDSAGLLMRKGETHIVFARLFRSAKAPHWAGMTTACMLPEGGASSDSAFVKEFDLWFRTKKS